MLDDLQENGELSIEKKKHQSGHIQLKNPWVQPFPFMFSVADCVMLLFGWEHPRYSQASMSECQVENEHCLTVRQLYVQL